MSVTVVPWILLGGKKYLLSFRFVVCLKDKKDDLSKRNPPAVAFQENMQERIKICGKQSAGVPQKRISSTYNKAKILTVLLYVALTVQYMFSVLVNPGPALLLLDVLL